MPETWKWLQGQAANGEIDMGIASLDQMVGEAVQADPGLLKRLNRLPRTRPRHAARLRGLLGADFPVPCPNPDVSLFLHGPDRSAPEVQVVWRADLDPAAPIGLRGQVPWTCARPRPRSHAGATSRIPQLVEWRRCFPFHHMCDVEGGLSIEKEVTGKGPPRHALRWLGLDDRELRAGRHRLPTGRYHRPSGPVSAAGMSSDTSRAPEGDFGIDRGDEANALYAARRSCGSIPRYLTSGQHRLHERGYRKSREAEEIPEDACELRDLLRSCCEAGGCPAAVGPSCKPSLAIIGFSSIGILAPLGSRERPRAARLGSPRLTTPAATGYRATRSPMGRHGICNGAILLTTIAEAWPVWVNSSPRSVVSHQRR